MHKRKTQYVSNAAAPVTGDGLLDFAIQTGYSQPSKEALQRFGDAQIQSIAIVRTPLQAALNLVLNKGTNGDFNKTMSKNNYESFFHLTMYVTTTAGRVSVEKNAVVTIQEAGARSSQADIMDVQGNFTTINDMVARAQQHMGTKKYFLYNSGNNNCQDYVWGLLEANGLGTSELHAFVKQETRSIFANSPTFRKIANSLTDIGAAVDPYIERAKAHVANLPAVQLANAIMQPKKTMRRIKRGVRRFFGGDLGEAGYSKTALMKMKKADLIDLILEMQE